MASSLWSLGGLSAGELAKRVYNEIWEDGLLDSAAQLAYYFLFALFPLLIFLTSIFGFVVGSDGELRNSLFKYLGTILPTSATDLVNSVITEVANASGSGKLTIGLFLALWAASSGMEAITQSLNRVYEVEETRSWWKRRLLSLFLTIVLTLLIISALIMVLFGGHIADYLAASYGYDGFFSTTWLVLQWILVLAFVMLAFALIYYFSPDVREQRWYFVSPGSVVGVALWLLVSFGFRVYLQYFNSYSATYGSLGAVIILMLWLYFTGAAILIGGEINSEIENAISKAGAPEAKEKGEKDPQENERQTGKAPKHQLVPTRTEAEENTTEYYPPVNYKSPKPHLNIFGKVFTFASMLMGVMRSFRSR